MKKYNHRILWGVVFMLLSTHVAFPQSRKEIEIPNILGYQTLKCDLNLHTVFSDGDVWPTVRVQEAWLEGLDAIAITDHIEFLPHSQDITANHNRSFELAEPLANQQGILLIQGAEITRTMPPGHLTALFITNANLLEREEWWDACVEARDQGGFIFWNHPGRKDQFQGETKWWDEHSQLYEANMLHGIEIYTNNEFYPEALSWAKDKNLSILGTSDLHAPSSMEFDLENSHRPITLVFAVEKSTNAIKEALLDRRTAVYYENTLVGERRFLAPIFSKSIEFMDDAVNLKNHEVKKVMIHNNSDLTYYLTKRQPSAGFSTPDEIVLPPHRTIAVELTGTSNEVRNMAVLRLFYEVRNLRNLSGGRLMVNIDIPNL